MKEKAKYLKYIPVTSEIYKQLQKVWSDHQLNYFDHTPIQAATVAENLGLLKAADWIGKHPQDYHFGHSHGQWRLAGDFNGKVVCHRFRGDTGGPSALTNVPRSVVHHSPTGHEWGYQGSGPSDLALDILNWFLPPNRQNGKYECWLGKASLKAWQFHHQFKREFLSNMPTSGGIIPKQEILNWINQEVKAA